MDILTHALSGVAVATCSSCFVPATPTRKIKILLTGLVGGAFPDIDAISMWSRFDATFGHVFNLSHTGKIIYGSKFWYSHHAFFHSLLASILLGILLIMAVFVVHRMFCKKDNFSFSSFCKSHFIYFVTFVLAYWAHLAGDLPTPSSVWGGVALFWPLQDYVGGSGKIWWWNNYDIFLLISLCIIINLIIPIVSKSVKKKSKIITSAVLCLTFVFILIQINTREFEYAYDGNTNKYALMEKNSKEEQKRILGKRMYKYMEWLDGKLKFYF